MFELFGMLYSPGRFIQQGLKGPPRLKMPFLIVVLAAILGMLSSLLTGGRLLDRVSDQTRNVPDIDESMKLVRLGVVISNVFGTLQYPLIWIIGTGILICMTILLEGEGDYRKLLQLNGYALLPLLVFGLVGILFAMTWRPSFEIQQLEAGVVKNHPEALRDRVQDALRVEMGASNFRFLAFLQWGCEAWTAVLIYLSLRAASKMSDAKSVLSLAALIGIIAVTQLIRSAFAVGGI